MMLVGSQGKLVAGSRQGFHERGKIVDQIPNRLILDLLAIGFDAQRLAHVIAGKNGIQHQFGLVFEVVGQLVIEQSHGQLVGFGDVFKVVLAFQNLHGYGQFGLEPSGKLHVTEQTGLQ